MKRLLGLVVLGAAAAFIATRKRASMHRRAEDAQFRRDLERFEGEGGSPATL